MTIQCMHCGARFHGQAANSRCPSCRGPARDGALRTGLRGDDEGSGLIDLRAMRAGLAGRELASASVSASVPVLGGLSPGLPVTPMTPPARPITRSNATLPASQVPLYSLVVALTLGLATLAAHVLTRPGPLPPQVVRTVIAAAPVVAAEAEAEPEPEPEAVAEAEPVVPEVVPGATAQRRVKPVGKVAPVKVTEPVKVNEPVKVTEPVKATEPDDSVDCLLGRKQCGKPREEVKPAEPVTPAPEAGLPAMLEQSDISAITGAGRSAASNACGELVKGGERVKLRLSIAGPSGSITSATVVDDAGNPQLAACAAQEVGRLAVKKVQKAQIGAMVTLKF